MSRAQLSVLQLWLAPLLPNGTIAITSIVHALLVGFAVVHPVHVARAVQLDSLMDVPVCAVGDAEVSSSRRLPRMRIGS